MAVNVNPTLSKSQYIKGLQCPKAFWFYRHRKDLAPEITPAKQAVFDTGNEVGLLAQDYFEGGIEVVADYWDVEKSIELTGQYIEKGYKQIYEATALHPANGLYSRIDILCKADDSDQWDLIEVKSSTSVKDYHIDDLSFQYYVFSNAGYKIRHCYMMVIDNKYQRSGEIDPQEFLRMECITDQVIVKQEEVEFRAEKLLTIASSKTEPIVDIGARCNKPFECDYKEHCWKHVPDYSIFNIYQSGKAEEIVNSISSFSINDIPDDALPSGSKLIDISSYRSGTIFVDEQNIDKFLKRLEYPLYYLDYETVWPAIPLYDGARPYQQVPFQFSLHIQRSPDSALEHHEFLHRDASDPRSAFAKFLIEVCGDRGSVIVYNQSFEEKRNSELARDFPEFALSLGNINARMIDLLVPFKNRWLYHPDQKGSASIKSVLPAFTDLNYVEMDIAGGEDASRLYKHFVEGIIDEGEVEKLWSDLSKYCALDTLAMVELIDVLREFKPGA